MTLDEIMQAVARGYCSVPDRVLDTTLAAAISEAVHKADNLPNLGLATTKELIDELAARASVSETIGESWPSYRTVE